jgi:hypothetical protein
MSRRANNLLESNYPLVSVQRFQSLKCDVNTRQLDELAKYISYVESASGDKPTEGEVVGAALTELLSSTVAFRSGKTGPRSLMQVRTKPGNLQHRARRDSSVIDGGFAARHAPSRLIRSLTRKE